MVLSKLKAVKVCYTTCSWLHWEIGKVLTFSFLYVSLGMVF